MAETWLLLAFGAIILYGTSQVALKSSLGHIPASVVVFLSILVSTPIGIVCLLPYLVTGEILDIEPLAFVLGLVAATFGQIGYYLYLEAAQRGPISVVGSVTSAYPIMVVAVALLFLPDPPGEIPLAGAMLVTSSIIVLSYIHGGKSADIHLSGRYFTLCVASLLLYGLWGIFTKLALEDVPSLLFLGMYAIVTPPTVMIYIKYKGLKLRHSIPTWSVAFMIAIIATEIANIGFFLEIYAVDQGPAPIVFPLVAAYPVVVIVLAYAFLKERLTKLETLLVAAVVAGVIIVSAA